MARRGRDPNAYRRMPKKGTKRREIIMQLLSKSGITAYEAMTYDLVKANSLNSYMEVLKNEQGWDIVAFSRPSEKPTTHTHELVYRIVGRFRPDGTYRDYSRWTISCDI